MATLWVAGCSLSRVDLVGRGCPCIDGEECVEGVCTDPLTGGDGDGDGDGDGAAGDGDGDVTAGDGDGDGDVAPGDGDGDGDGDSAGTRRKLTIDGAQVPAAQSGFVVLVRVTDGDIAASAASDGTDIHFLDAAGDPLAHELESYGPGDGSVVAWVRMDLTGQDQDFYMHYGAAMPVDHSDAAATWADYAAVYHMDYGGGAGTQPDSTANGNDLATTVQTPADAGGVAGRALNFEGGNKWLVADDHPSLDLTGALTLSVWVNPSAVNPSYFETLIAKRAARASETNYELYLGPNTLDRRLGYFDGSATLSADSVPDATFTYAAVTVAQGMCRFYRDGVLGTQMPGCDAVANAGRLHVGGFDNLLDQPFYGVLDEVRITGEVRSAQWLTTEFNNQRPDSTFITVGPRENL